MGEGGKGCENDDLGDKHSRCFHICAGVRGGQVASPPLAGVAALSCLLSVSLASLGQAPDPGAEGQVGMGSDVLNLRESTRGRHCPRRGGGMSSKS